MKQIFLLVISFISLVSNGQTSEDKEQVKKVVIAFQEGFNEGSFKNAQEYTTIDWEHINPFGGITRGRDSTLADVRSVDRKSTRLNSSHSQISYAVFCLK